MPTLNAEIEDIVAGDGIDITVNIGKVSGNFIGDAVEKVWFSVKTKKTDTSYLFQKAITSSNVPGTGVILDDGSVSGTAQVRVELVNANTVLLTLGKTYYFDLQVKTALGGVTKPYTPWSGLIKFKEEITTDTA